LNKKLVKIFELLVSIGITIGFIYLFYIVVGFDKIAQFFTELSIGSIAIAYFFYVLSYLTRAYRWKLTLSIKDFKKLFKITSFNTVFNIFLPFRTGELSFFYMLKKENVDMGETTLSFFTVRIFDAIALFSVFFISYLIYKDMWYLAIPVFFLMPFSFYIFKFLISFIKHEKIKKFHENVLSLKNLWVLYGLSFITFVFKFIGFYFILPPSVQLSFKEAFVAAAAGDLTTVLPVNGIAGLGTYEAGYAGILILMGVDKENALVASLFVHIFILIGSATLAGFCYLFLRDKKD